MCSGPVLLDLSSPSYPSHCAILLDVAVGLPYWILFVFFGLRLVLGLF